MATLLLHSLIKVDEIRLGHLADFIQRFLDIRPDHPSQDWSQISVSVSHSFFVPMQACYAHS